MYVGVVELPVFARVFIRVHNVCEEETSSIRILKITEKLHSPVRTFVDVWQMF